MPLGPLLLSTLLCLTPAAQDTASYPLEVEREWLTLADGTRLAATVFRPVPRHEDERFPVLLELLPYRMDDLFLARDHPLHSWFARRGFISVRVDLRGTGASEGTLPGREYSEQELADAAEVVGLLAAMPGSNGAVGMWGISWSGFTALQLGLDPPPALKAILVAHASENLFLDDSHFIDGLQAVSWYELTIDHWNGLPAPPDYAVGPDYFADRFDREPWVLQKFRHPRDGAWWRADHRGPLRVPAYMIGGLHDGYRDAVFRVARTAMAPVMAEIGPFGHSWPHSGGPGPAHEWGHRAVRWWNHWLRGEDTGLLAEPSLAVFVRSAPVPDAPRSATPGEWRWADLPYEPAATLALETAAGGELRPASSAPGARAGDGPVPAAADPAVASLTAETMPQDPASGTHSGLLWWEVPRDMRRDDAGARVYDGPRLDSALVIAGVPSARLLVGDGDCAAHWIVRLEDVRPDGRVDFVTGGAAGATCAPPGSPGSGPAELTVPLRFVTWTFRPGHRIRLAVTNAQFPMVWPSPLPTTSLLVGAAGTRLDLPLPRLRPGAGPGWAAPEAREGPPGLESLESTAPAHSRVVRDRYEGTVRVEEAWGEARRLGTREWSDRIAYAHRVDERDPVSAGFEGAALFTATTSERTVEVATTLTVDSNASWFTVVFRRTLRVDGELARERVWQERFERRSGSGAALP